MPFDTCPDLLVDESRASRRISAALAALAVVGMVGSLLIASPSRFSDEHLADRSPLRWVVDALSLYGKWPTLDGKEIRLSIFNLAAALMLLTAGLRLLTQNSQPRMALDDLLDFRARASSPVTWGVFFLFCSVLSSSFSDARRLTLGQSALHGFQLAWLLPLALLLEPRHARRLVQYMTWILSVTAIIGLWYYFIRVYPHSGFETRLKYPLGNELWMAVCLMPVPFLVVAQMIGHAGENRERFGKRNIVGLLMLVPVIAVMALTRSRSGAVGALFGLATLVALHTRGTSRRIVLLITAVIVVGASLWVAQERHKTDGWLRSHSLRARVDYAWPYAVGLWRIKPILGHGDGAYGLLAGQFARIDQIEDPSVMSFGDERIWLNHADSEPLQLLADLGIVGLFAAAAALGATLLAAIRFCDEAQSKLGANGDRRLVIGLTAALVAMAAEECSSNGLRLGGLPAVFMTTCALVWTLVRRHRTPREVAQPDQWMPAGVLRMAGLGITGVSLALAVAACIDAGATRSAYRASSALISNQNNEAVIEADLAARGSLSPYQQLKSRLFAIWAMSQEFDNRLKSDKPPDSEDFAVASAALGRLSSLDADAPRFLRAAALRVELFTNLARAAERRGEAPAAADFSRKRNEALVRLIADEPFRLDPVKALLQAEPAIPVMERLTWLRRLLRAGEMDPEFTLLFIAQAQVGDFIPVLNDLMNVAMADSQREPDSWQDRLSPETLRMTALALELQAKAADAIPLLMKADAMYARAGARLFAANAAVQHDLVRLRFATAPTADITQRLDELAQAARLAGMAVATDGSLPQPLGSTRLNLLLAAGRESQAAAQAAYLFPSAPANEVLAQGYLSLVSAHAQFNRDNAIQWAMRATEISPRSLDAHAAYVSLLLNAGHDDVAAKHLRKLPATLDPGVYSKLVDDLKKQFPQSRIWTELSTSPG